MQSNCVLITIPGICQGVWNVLPTRLRPCHGASDQYASAHLLHVIKMITVKRLAPFGFTLFGLKIAATPHAQVMLIPIAQEWTRPNLTNTTTVRSVSAQSSVLPSYETQSIISISSATSAGSTPPSGVLSIGSPTLGASTVVTKASIPPLIIPMAGYHPWQAVPKQLNRRQNDPILTEAFLITPSPNASPVSITEMRQLVTSFTPVLTICPFVEPALSLEVSQMNTSLLASVNKATVEGPRGNGAYTNRKSVGVAFKKRSRDVSPYQLTTSCSVSYMSTTTQYCHTNLSPLGAPEISVTQCDQSVTFSSEFGYKVLPANAMTEPTFVNQKITLYSAWVLQTLTTYYVAAWSDINPGAVPAGPLGVVICSKDVCSTEWEVWETGTAPSQRMTSTFNIVATATGVSRLPQCIKTVSYSCER